MTERRRSASSAKRANGRPGKRSTARVATRNGKQPRKDRPAEPVRVMRIRQLDPYAACGRGTTVMQLFRVDDLPTASATTHLVFLDRHGWYCEHGRECPAVAAVRKHIK
ncbi:MAG: hypothetical protein ACREON_08415 [Gemmatimonadaceae bacterium]